MIARISCFALALLAATVLAAPARSANVPFEATFAFEIVGMPPIEATGTGVAIVNGSGGGGAVDTLAMPAGAIDAAGVQAPGTGGAIGGLQLTVANAAGTFAGDDANIALAGQLKICLFGGCAGSAVANLSVPLSVVGAGGTATFIGGINLTVIGAPWTTGTVTLIGGGGTPITRMGSRQGPGSGMISTAAPSGRIQLVTPIFISTNLGSPLLPSFGTLTLHFVPEPATLGLLGAGVAGLAVAGRRRLGMR